MTQPASAFSPKPPATVREPNLRARRWGQRLYVLGGAVYLAGIAIGLLAGHPTARTVAWTLAGAALFLGAGGAALLMLRRRRTTRACGEAGAQE